MAYTLKIPQSEIDKIKLVRAPNNFETLASVRKRTGADVIINGGFYRMATGVPETWLVIDGKTIATGGSGYGYAIDINNIVYAYQNNIKYPQFIGAARGLVKDGMINLIGNDTNKRGRTAMGLTVKGELVLYVVLDTDTPNKITTLQLANKMVSLGCVNAIELDGGGSSQYYANGKLHSSGRAVSWWICLWLKGSDAKMPSNTKPVLIYGSSGEAVKDLQRILKIEVDGSFGPATLNAVKEFQKVNGLAVDGSVGPATWAKLLGEHKLPTRKFKVCLDAGHSIETPGKRSPDGTYYEHEFNLDMARRMEAILVNHGIDVVLTRTDILGLANTESKCLEKRVQIANSIKDLGLFVSLHSNAATDTGWSNARGYEVYTSSSGDNAERNKAAKALIDAARQDGIMVRANPLKHSLFYVLKYTNAPAILIEHGYHTNKEEVELLKSETYRDKLAKANCKGILSYFGIGYVEVETQEISNRDLVKKKFLLDEATMIYLDGYVKSNELYKKMLGGVR